MLQALFDSAAQNDYSRGSSGETSVSEASYFEAHAGGIEVIRWPHKHLLPESEVIAYFESRRMPYTRWSREAGGEFAGHSHAYRKILFCVLGEITFTLTDQDQEILLRPGDRLSLPAGIAHSASVGPEGVICIEAGV